jgi:4-hydroxy-3-polyprenylbenzoate decarboxylase
MRDNHKKDNCGGIKKVRRIIVGITGATGVIYGIRLLEALKSAEVETHLILSDSGKKNIRIETDFTIEDVEGLASQVHDIGNLASSISSGSFRTGGMVIAPCTVKTLSGVAHSYNDNLIVRAADVVLKERRRLVLVVRETPLHKGHLELMSKVADIGGIILPPIPAFYHSPRTIDDLLNHTVGKIMDLLEIDNSLFTRWKGINK